MADTATLRLYNPEEDATVREEQAHEQVFTKSVGEVSQIIVGGLMEFLRKRNTNARDRNMLITGVVKAYNALSPAGREVFDLASGMAGFVNKVQNAPTGEAVRQWAKSLGDFVTSLPSQQAAQGKGRPVGGKGPPRYYVSVLSDFAYGKKGYSELPREIQNYVDSVWETTLPGQPSLRAVWADSAEKGIPGDYRIGQMLQDVDAVSPFLDAILGGDVHGMRGLFDTATAVGERALEGLNPEAAEFVPGVGRGVRGCGCGEPGCNRGGGSKMSPAFLKKVRKAFAS